MTNDHSWDFYKIHFNLAVCSYLMILPVAISYSISSFIQSLPTAMSLYKETH